jgi:hypothetical protein
MAAKVIKRKGYGQVEPNHLSGIVTGQIYAQLPTDTTKTVAEDGTVTLTGIKQLEQGQFAKYDYAAGKVDFTGDGEFMLVYNEEKLYDERKQSHKDFVYKAEDFTDYKMYPRLIKTNVGDIFTTNTIGVKNTSDTAEVGTVELKETDYLQVTASGDNAGFLAKASGTGMPASGMVWKVVKVYTMPDGQPGVKIQRVQ